MYVCMYLCVCIYILPNLFQMGRLGSASMFRRPHALQAPSEAVVLGDELLLDALVKPFSLPREISKCVSCN